MSNGRNGAIGDLFTPLNAYDEVHINASYTTQKKIESHKNWYANVYKLLEETDILSFNGMMRNEFAIRRRAAKVFQSYWNRKTHLRIIDEMPVYTDPAFGSDVERDALVQMVEKSLQNYYKRTKPTTTQIETYFLERQAKQQGARVDKFIANVLGISEREARRRLSTSRKVKTPLNDGEVDIINIERSVMKELSRACAWCNKPTKHGLRTFCDEHHKLFLVDGNFETVLVTDDEFWRIKNKADANHYQKAIDYIRKNNAA